jgi:predicted metalloprotease
VRTRSSFSPLAHHPQGLLPELFGVTKKRRVQRRNSIVVESCEMDTEAQADRCAGILAITLYALKICAYGLVALKRNYVS